MWNQIVSFVVNKLVLSILEWAAKYLPHVINEWRLKKKREMEQSEAKAKHDAIQADPNISMEEKMKAHADYMNSGRKQ